MFPTDSCNINELTDLAEQFGSIHSGLETQTVMQDIYTPAHQRAYLRLQNAISEYRIDPCNEAKSKSLFNAIDTFQTANEIMAMKISNAIEMLEAR